MPTRAPLSFLVSAFALLAATACSGPSSDEPTGMTFRVSESETLQARLGTCSLDQRKAALSQTEAEAAAWSVGSRVAVAGAFERPCTATKSCEPLSGVDWSLLGAPNFDFHTAEDPQTGTLGTLVGEVKGWLHSSAPGTGGIGVTYKGTAYGPISLKALAPARLELASFPSWDGQTAPQESPIAGTVQAHSSMNVILRPFEAEGERLCGRVAVDTAGTVGMTVEGDVHLGTQEPQANAAFVLKFGEAGPATLVLTAGGATLRQDFTVVP